MNSSLFDVDYLIKFCLDHKCPAGSYSLKGDATGGFNESCYLFHNTTTKDKLTAEQHCDSSNGGHLLVMETEAEFVFIQDILWNDYGTF